MNNYSAQQNVEYESSYRRQNQTRDPRYSPNTVANEAEALQREFNARERQYTQEEQIKRLREKSELDRIKNSTEQQQADAKQLQALGEFSQTLAAELTLQAEAKGKADFLDEMQYLWKNGVPASNMKKFDDAEAELAGEGAAIDTAGYEIGQQTTAANERAVRQTSGWRSYARMAHDARMAGISYAQSLSSDWKTFEVMINGKPVTMESANNNAELQTVMDAYRAKHFEQYSAFRPELMEKYMRENMQTAENLVLTEWGKIQENKLNSEKREEALIDMRTAVIDGNPGAGFEKFLYSGNYGGDRRKAMDALVEILGNMSDEGKFNATDLIALKGYTLTVGPHKGKTIGEIYGGQLSKIQGRANKADSVNAKNFLEQQRSKLTNLRAAILKQEELNRQQGIETGLTETQRTTFLDQLKTLSGTEADQLRTELANMKSLDDIESEEEIRRLKLLRPTDFYITSAEAQRLSPAVRAANAEAIRGSAEDKQNQAAMKEGEKYVKTIVREKFGAAFADNGEVKTRDGLDTILRATAEWNSVFLKARRDGVSVPKAIELANNKIESRLDPAVKAGTLAKDNPYTADSYLDSEEAVDLETNTARKELQANPNAVNTGVIKGTEDSFKTLVKWHDAGGVENTQGLTLPPVYSRLASMYPQYTALDIANRQLEAMGYNPSVPRAEQFRQGLSPEVQLLLTNNPTPSRTLRAMNGGNTPTGDMTKQFLDMVASVESRGYGDYDAMNTPGANTPYNSVEKLGQGVSTMTIGEVIDRQERGDLHAAGRYQFTNNRKSLLEAMETAGLTREDMFSPENQDALALARARWRINQGTGMTGLRNEWVGLEKVSDAVLRPFVSHLVDTSSPYNQRQNLLPSLARAVYTTGNIGPTSTGPHLDVKQVGGGRFAEDELDQYVVVDDPDYGRVGLGRLRQLTGGVGDNFDEHVARGSHGIDYGTHAGTQVYLQNGAQVVSTQPSQHGDILTIQIPDGRQFTFLHGTTN